MRPLGSLVSALRDSGSWSYLAEIYLEEQGVIPRVRNVVITLARHALTPFISQAETRAVPRSIPRGNTSYEHCHGFPTHTIGAN